MPVGHEREGRILRELFLRIGFPFALTNGEASFPVQVSYGPADGRGDVLLPMADHRWTGTVLPEFGTLEGLPFACPPAARPHRLREGNRILLDVVGMGEFFLSGRVREWEPKVSLEELRRLESFICVPIWDLAAGFMRGVIEGCLKSKGIEGVEGARSIPFPGITFSMTHDVDHLLIGGLGNLFKSIDQSRRLLLEESEGKLAALRRILLKGLRGIAKYGLKGRSLPFGPSLELERKHGLRSTIFVYGGRGDQPMNPSYDLSRTEKGVSGIVSSLREHGAQGWDIGLHGSTYAASSPEVFLAELSRLRAATGIEVCSSRFHRLRFDPHGTSRVLRDSSVGLDSSLGLNKLLGFVCGTALPFRLPGRGDDGERDGPVEVPITLHDICLLKKADRVPKGMIAETVAFIDRMRGVQAQGLLNMLWHHETLFRLKGGSDPMAVYESLLSAVREKGCPFMTLDEVGRRWAEHEERICG